MVLSVLFPRYFHDFRNFLDLEIGYPAFKTLLYFKNAEIYINAAEITEISRKVQFFKDNAKLKTDLKIKGFSINN